MRYVVKGWKVLHTYGCSRFGCKIEAADVGGAHTVENELVRAESLVVEGMVYSEGSSVIR